ncbi:MAG: RtcB family protein [candidate division WOR-3 bacterium]
MSAVKYLKRVDNYTYILPEDYKKGMRVPGLIFTDEKLMPEDEALEQVANVATLPGIVKYSIGMPDIHWGYGFPVGGVAAFRVDEGVVSPGGIGFDINCGVRLIKTNLHISQLDEKTLEKLADKLYEYVPSGVGVGGPFKATDKDLERVSHEGAKYMIELGYGFEDDYKFIEEEGCIPNADFSHVFKKAKDRGRDQLGTLGSGNHFLEVQVIDKIYNDKVAKEFGLFKGQVVVMIHCGSRGFGHQIADDYIGVMLSVMERKYKIFVPDKQLACAPITSPEGSKYLKAMACAANYAFSNRQLITHNVRRAFEEVLKKPADELGMFILYDVAHNIAKFEKYNVDGEEVEVLVHRKGATRAFPPGRPEIPEVYRNVGQPVIIPGDMGRYSFVLVGAEGSIEKSFGSTCHGAGRVLSRRKAKSMFSVSQVVGELSQRGIRIRASSKATILEEVPEAYKDAEAVVRIVQGVGISRIVSRNKPVIVVKG